MKRILILGAALAVAATLTATTWAADTPSPFPAASVQQIFVAAQTVTTDGAMSSWFTPGSKVVFRAYAVDPKSKQLVDPKAVRYFYVSIPNEPTVKLKYDAKAAGASAGLPWTGTWTVPATYAAGSVPFKVLIQVKDTSGKQRKGQFVQIPVSTATLNISPTAPAPFSPGATTGDPGAANGKPMALSIYVDSVNGTAPAGVASRTIGCTLTNVYKRGERVVIRSWGSDLSTNDLLSNDNVKEAHFSIPGQQNVALTWGAHGSTGSKVYFWSGPWIVPNDFPLGETTVTVSYTTDTGKTGTYDFKLNIIP